MAVSGSTLATSKWERWFAYVDIALAQLLTSNEELHSLIAYLSMAARHGHLCICIEEQHITPDPSHLCQEDEQEKPQPFEELHELREAILLGKTQLSESLCSFVDDNTLPPSTPLCRQGNRFYLQRYWVQETACLDRFVELLATEPHVQIDEQLASNHVQDLISQKLLLPEQAQAILQNCNRSIAFLCGGPGTGKTYTAAHWIALYWKALSPEQQRRTEIAMTAPTGKAAANLQHSLAKVISSIKEFKPVQAKTLHALLGIFSRNPSPVTADVILVDESSMIDVHLMVTLLSAVKPGTRLIFLGDPNQLPPVEMGSIFKDIVQTLQQFPKQKPAELTTCLRMESAEIVKLAEAIRQEEGIEQIPFVDLDIMGTTPAQRQQAILKYTVPHFIVSADVEDNPTKLIEHFHRFRLLSPLRRGLYGVDALNEMLAQEVRKRGASAVPIMITRNTPDLNLFNGDVGVLVPEHNYALFEGRKIPSLQLPAYEYAYCLSVHKSQGSEFDSVLLLMPEGADVFGREVLYTAVTRARKRLDIWTTGSVLKNTLSQPSQRLSGISERLTLRLNTEKIILQI